MRRENCFQIRLAPLLRVQPPALSLPRTRRFTMSLGNPALRRRSGTQVERHDDVQLVAGCPAESRCRTVAVSSLLYLLQVHVRQHGLLRSLEQRLQRLSILAKHLRSARRNGRHAITMQPMLFRPMRFMSLPFGRGKKFARDVDKVVECGHRRLGRLAPSSPSVPDSPCPSTDPDESGTFSRGSRPNCNGNTECYQYADRTEQVALQWFTNDE